jgi:hypothetical protein
MSHGIVCHAMLLSHIVFPPSHSFAFKATIADRLCKVVPKPATMSTQDFKHWDSYHCHLRSCSESNLNYSNCAA